MANSSSTSGGIGLTGALFLIFLTLKLLAIEPVATWSWWWVTAPLWGGLAAVLAFIVLVLAVHATGSVVAWISKGISRRVGSDAKWRKVARDG